MLPYIPIFGVLVLACTLIAYRQHRHDRAPRKPDEETELRLKTDAAEAAAKHFKWIFLPVYLLVMGSDWLQGPYIYTLYKDEKGLEESVVAALFLTGFGSAAISATFIGSLADRFGRRSACIGFCLIYTLSCMSTLFDNLIILFIGRMLGGVATTLMYSVFESWMVTEYHHRRLDQSSMTLSSMFGLMTTLNSSVAIGAGLLGQLAVSFTKTKTSPFMVAIVTLGTAAWLMLRGWNENYGDSASSTSQTPSKSTFSILLKDKRILVLGFISTIFEGSMYLFIFFWSSALKSAHLSASPTGSITEVPHGLIFASFMCSMMLGSLLFSYLSSRPNPTPSSRTSTLLPLTLALAAITLLLPLLLPSLPLTLSCFCLFEMCVGVYYPCMGFWKGRVVDDGVRARIYGVLRIPLNVLVVLVLAGAEEGDAHRERVFLGCGAGLLVASAVAALGLGAGVGEAVYDQVVSEDDVGETEDGEGLDREAGRM